MRYSGISALVPSSVYGWFDARSRGRRRTEGTSRCPSTTSGVLMTLVIPDVLEEGCTTRQALERLASKWRVLLVYALLAGPQRHAELRRRVAGITQKDLTGTRRDMGRDGLVERRVVYGAPPRPGEEPRTAHREHLPEAPGASAALAT